METLSLVCQICVEFLNIRVGKTGTGKLIPQRARRQLVIHTVRQLQLERYRYKLNHSDISGEWSIQQKGYKRSNGSKQIDSKEIAET
jgi:hypothetical protein